MVGNKSRRWKYDRKGKYRRPRGIKIARTKEYFTLKEIKISLKLRVFWGSPCVR